MNPAEVDGDLYALTYDGLYVFASGETKPTHYDFPLSSNVDDGDDDEDTAVTRSAVALIAYEGRPCVIVAEMETEYEGEGEERGAGGPGGAERERGSSVGAGAAAMPAATSTPAARATSP